MNWEELSNEDLCLEYQRTRDDDLFTFLYYKNVNLIMFHLRDYIKKYPEHRDLLDDIGRFGFWECVLHLNPNKGKLSSFLEYYIKKEMRLFYKELQITSQPDNLYEKLTKRKEKYPYAMWYKDDYEEELLADENTNVELTVEKHNCIERLMSSLRWVNPREKMMILEYYGFNDSEPPTIEQMSKKYGITRQRVQQIIANGLKKLKRMLKREDF